MLRPSWPIPGPNGVHGVRTTAERVEAMIDEVRAIARARSLPLMWVVTDDVEPADLPERLIRRGILPDPGAPETATMALGPGVDFGPPPPEVTIENALASLEVFSATIRCQERGFGAEGQATASDESYRIRWEEARQGSGLVFLARWKGRPAAGATVTIEGPAAIMNGGTVVEEFRGRGVYRALVGTRYRAAIEAGAVGVVTNARPTSRPILQHFGFKVIGRRRYFRDLGTAGT